MTARVMPDARTQDAASEERAGYLTLSLDGEIFALRLDLVREVLDPPPVTMIPNAPDVAPGLVNVRGAIMPYVDLRRRLGLERAVDTQRTRLVVAWAEAGAERFLVGFKADAVHEVLDLPPGAVEPLPELGTRWAEAFVSGVARHDGRFVLFLDLDRVLGAPPHPIA